ncbi:MULTISPECIES: helix-turn-helix transcriptional regulator [Bacillus cereus group]|uniref:helix-turn-helix transcriptional regulator n=1 Tax=Bacillus cereus group TaxID=86661 RepID=UPI0008642D33|nr:MULTISPECIES: helix-turn-helix transcriptional regulator [Bacillus cereus group]AWC29471.1 XRE family transcriptional regulator [Bacillus cytotoxicus]AWC33484.1 XRE family transcriptional regulator [Bacillus cytotoxicus]AWC37462.1 XRE family transcriptional regulator [Bacillus cytotoxicus]AWC41602.1 XRE family transcriptional regulator [Bacillus cytotoxicus]AWC45446.1 XRE family transcriptional regulator [Bacillus cytotoxicus]
MKFKCKLRVIFAEREIRQKEFAELIGISQTTMSALVNNTSLPTFPTAYKIAKYLNLYMEDIWIEDIEEE